MNFKGNSILNSINSRVSSFISNKSDKTAIQLIKYGFVGGIAYTLDFGSLILLTEVFKIHYLISAALAFIMGLITNYVLSILWVFSKRTLTNKKVEFLIFSIIGLIGLGINEGIIWFFTESAHFHYLISKIFSTFVIFFWNFFARKKVLFS